MSGFEVAMVGLTVLGTGVSIAGQMAQSSQAAKMAEYNATLERNRAIEAEQVSAEQERRHRESARRMLAAQRASIGASGVDIGTGSALLAQADSAANLELDALTIRHSGSAEAARARSAEAAERFRAAGIRSNRFFGPAASLLKGGTRVGEILGN